MNRHAKSLQTKAKHHTVTRLDFDLFSVESATSGDTHLVRRSYTGHLSCDCEWSTHHLYKSCSHVLAVRKWEANTASITLSFWTDQADALRQHRSVVVVDSDILATRRRKPVDPVDEALRLIAAQDAAAMSAFVNKHDPDYDTTPDTHIENLTIWTAMVMCSEPFSEQDTRRAALREIVAYSLCGERAAEAARAAVL